jgi:hypothetical protein
MPSRRSTAHEYSECINALRGTTQGHERNMYSYIKRLFVHFLGHADADVLIDVSARARLGPRSIPDVQVAVRLPSGIILDSWVVIEAKDEVNIFLDHASREAIYQEKSKYITSDTEWFVMVDPGVLVLRHLAPGRARHTDTMFYLDGLALDTFITAFAGLTLDSAFRREKIESFRAGEERWIASLDLDQQLIRDRFYKDLHKSFGLLYEGCQDALVCVTDYLIRVRQLVERAQIDYGGTLKLSFDPFGILAPKPHISQTAAFRRDSKTLRNLYFASPKTFRLAFQTLPGLGCTNPTAAGDMDDAIKAIARDTASLLLSRALMLRFLEDHGFFGTSKYLCNGGLHAFVEMMRYFDTLYPALIQQACAQGARYYHAIFTGSDYDWVFESRSPFLSSGIEQVLYYLSFFNFASVREDVLSGIYQKIIDPSMRKKLGQVYTPPQVARYLVKKCRAIVPEGPVLDPACGTGTFLVEYFEDRYGDQIRRNAVAYDNIRASIGDIRGNDISSVASSITQMQLLWRLLPFAAEMKREGFPEIAVATSDALRIQTDYTTFWERINEWDEIENSPGGQAMVLGNPPYVRPERQSAVEHYDSHEIAFYGGVSVQSNLYNLFIYKAMNYWLRPGGVLGFVVSLSLLDNKDSAGLRSMFAPGGRWRIVEIVDMEEVAGDVFPGVTVNPILFIAEKRPPTAEDHITLRVAGSETLVTPGTGDFDFGPCTEEVLPYPDVFTSDGRILSRITPARKRILDVLGAFPIWDSIAREYWTGRRGNRIIEAALERPASSDLRWEQKRMLTMGAAFRGRAPVVATGYSVYKGENISACQLVEPPVREHIDIQHVDDPSLWSYPDILPAIGYAFQGISINLTACRFNPRQKVFLNTATLFFPAEAVEAVPFDFLVLSSMYQWLFAVSQREGVIAKGWSHVYPRTISRLPWSDRILEYAGEMETCRNDYLEACRQLNQVLLEQLVAVTPLENLQERAERIDRMEMRWPANPIPDGEGWHRYSLFSGMFDYFYINDQEAFEMLEIILPVLGIDSVDQRAILLARIPSTPDGVEHWRAIMAGEDRIQAQAAKTVAIDRLDSMVATAFGLSEEDTAFIRQDLSNNSLFSRLRPTEPYSAHRLRGLWSGLDRPDRYR